MFVQQPKINPKPMKCFLCLYIYIYIYTSLLVHNIQLIPPNVNNWANRRDKSLALRDMIDPGHAGTTLALRDNILIINAFY